jgi:hypothetical protein
MKAYKIILLLTIVLYCFPQCVVYSEQYNHASLYGYNGYLTTPSAYIDEGSFKFHYTYLPSGAGPFHKGKSDNWVFTSSLGLFSFMECYLSFYVSPDYEWKESGRGDTTRSPGVKINILNEKKLIPAVAIGLFDPFLDDTIINYRELASQTISSSFVVMSKNIGISSFSIGYGFERFLNQNTRLRGIFGGGNFLLSDFLSIMIDYDGELWSEGLYAHWKNINLSLSYIGDNTMGYRIGYQYDLFHD